MKKSLFLSIPLMMFLVSCGHNVLTNYEVKGLDVSVPIFGYPFGLRLGVVKANQNLIRGDSTYTIHSNTGTELGSGTVQETQVIQFSANTQINEGNVEKIMQSKNVSDDVKKSFVENYLSSNQAPAVLPTSTNTPTTVTATGENPKIHKKQFEEEKQSLWSLSGSALVKKMMTLLIDFFLLSTAGKIISIIASILLVYFLIRITYWLMKKILERRLKQ